MNKTKTLKVQHICDRRHFDFVRNTHTEAQPLECTVPVCVPVKKCTNSSVGYEFVQPILNLVLLCVLTETGCVDCLQLFYFLVQIRTFVIKTSLGIPNLNMKGKTKRILVVLVRWRHSAHGLFSHSLRFESSLPADVLWGSFVTHSFLPKDVCGEAILKAVLQ